MTERQKIVETLGDRLFQAARASIAQGAHYEPGENISTDAKSAWTSIAESLVSLVEIAVREGREVRKTDDA